MLFTNNAPYIPHPVHFIINRRGDSDGYSLFAVNGWIGSVSRRTHDSHDDGAVSEGEKQPTGHGKLSQLNESSSCIVYGACTEWECASALPDQSGHLA